MLQEDIQVKEGEALRATLQLLTEQFPTQIKGKTLLCKVDNQVLKAVIERKGTSQNWVNFISLFNMLSQNITLLTSFKGGTILCYISLQIWLHLMYTDLQGKKLYFFSRYHDILKQKEWMVLLNNYNFWKEYTVPHLFL